VWVIDISHEGKRVRKSTGTADKKLAEAIQAKVTTQLIEGKWFDLDQSKTRTLEEVKGKYLEERSSHKSPASYKRDKSCFNHLMRLFGNCPLSEITPSRINEYKQSRLKKADPQTVAKELAVLRNAFNVAIREWEWCRENPVSRVSMPKAPQGRVRFLSIQQIKDLLDHSEEWFMPVVIVALHTGMRQGNILTLTWDKIDLFRRLIILDKTKNGERLTIPINDTLFETLKDLSKVRLLSCNLLFHRNGKPFYQNQLRRALKKACDGAGIEDFRFHDLRHTFASLLVQSGENLYTVQRLLGHKDGRMTQRYAHLTHERFVSAVKILDGLCHKSAIVEGERKGASL
jgi:integrase